MRLGGGRAGGLAGRNRLCCELWGHTKKVGSASLEGGRRGDLGNIKRPGLLDTWRGLLPLSHKEAGGRQKRKAYAQSRPAPRAPSHSPPFPSKAGSGSRPLSDIFTRPRFRFPFSHYLKCT